MQRELILSLTLQDLQEMVFEKVYITVLVPCFMLHLCLITSRLITLNLQVVSLAGNQTDFGLGLICVQTRVMNSKTTSLIFVGRQIFKQVENRSFNFRSRKFRVS